MKGTLVHVSVRLHGGDGGGAKDILRVVALIAVVVFAPQIAAALAPGLVGTTAGALLTAGIAVAGQLVVNAIFPPPKPGQLSRGSGALPESPTYAIEGTRNQIRPWGLIPTVLGQVRVTPPKAIAPFTENEGTNQFVTEQFAIGIGPTWFHRLQLAIVHYFYLTTLNLSG